MRLCCCAGMRGRAATRSSRARELRCLACAASLALPRLRCLACAHASVKRPAACVTPKHPICLSGASTRADPHTPCAWWPNNTDARHGTRRRSIANLSPGPTSFAYARGVRANSSWPGELSEDFDEDMADTDVYCQVCAPAAAAVPVSEHTLARVCRQVA